VGIDFTTPTIIDNYLPDAVFEDLKNTIVYNENFDLNFQYKVSLYDDDIEDKTLWNYYFTHSIFKNCQPTSKYFPLIYNTFITRLSRDNTLKTLQRIKVNCYPHTDVVKEHQMHCDKTWFIKAALFTLNTCDGYTKMENGDKIESIENRLILFDASKLHCSTTTSNEKSRYNINFNFL